MTTLELLQLRGIRSYNPSSVTQITFSSPLTILAGHTGTGKTAILEALKLAAIGELPQNGKKIANGVDFVHDPVIRSRNKTDATVCLTFTDVDGVKRRVDRRFVLTASPSSDGWRREFARPKGTIQQVEAQAAIESCSEKQINETMSRFLRVTKAVLDNVVLVRQEESLWPLGKPGELKRVMDDIVAATSYANVLKQVRSCKQDLDKERGNVETEMDKYAAKVQGLERLGKEVDDMKVLHQHDSSDVQVLENDLVGLRSEWEEASAIFEEHGQKCSELKELRDKKDRTEWSKSMLHPPSSPSEHALEANIKRLEASLARTGNQRSKSGNEIENCKADIEKKTSEQRALQDRKRGVDEDIRLHERLVKRLENLREEFLRADFFGNTNNPINPESGALPPRTSSITDPCWTRSLEICLEDEEESVAARVTDGKKKKDGASDRTSDAHVRVESARQKMTRVRERFSAVRRELSSLADPQQSLEEAKQDFENLQRSWEGRSKQAAHLKHGLEKQRRDVRETDNKLRVLEKTRKDVENDHQEQARYRQCLEVERSAKSRVDRVLSEFTTLICACCISDHSTDLLPLGQSLEQSMNIDHGHSPATAQERKKRLFDAHRKVLTQKHKELHEAELTYKKMDAARNAASGRKSQAEAHLGDVEKELEEAENKVRGESRSLSAILRNVVDNERLPFRFPTIQGSSNGARFRLLQGLLQYIEDAITKVNTEVQKAGTRKIQLETGAIHAEKDLADFENDSRHQCPACGLSSKSRVEEMRSNLRSRVQTFKNPRNREVAAHELKKLTDAREILQKVHQVVCEALSMKPGVNRAKDNLDGAKRYLDYCDANAEQAQSSFETIKSRLRDRTNVGKSKLKREECEQAFEDWQSARNKVRNARAVLSQRTRDHRSLSEFDAEMSNLRQNLRQQQEIVDSKTQELEASFQIQRRFLEAKVHFTETISKKRRHSELSRSANAYPNELVKLEGTIAKLREEHDLLRANYCSIRDAADAAVEKGNNKVSERRSALDKWKACLSEIQDCNRLEKDQERNNVISSLERLEKEITLRTEALESLELDQKSRQELRNLQNDQEFHRLERLLSDIDQGIQDKQKQVSDLEQKASGNPASKVKDIEVKIKEKDVKIGIAKNQKEIHWQKLTELEEGFGEMRRQGFRRKFDECRVKKLLNQAASNDLEQYYRAKNQALTTFHTLSMQSINKTIKELWHQINHGTDIDDIEITADDLKTDPNAALRRDFTYRVQMRQGEAKVDMRGRCSTGQKVLACLVIRLALAESFCTDCGIFALDQPTANLDREHTESLAVALRTIIENRRKRGKFQLLLITQDREFIDMLGAQDYCDDFYVISKDGHGISKAELKGWQEL